MSYAAEWELDDAVLDRDEIEAVVQHVASLGQVVAEVAPSRRGLYCTFRFPVHAASDVVTALDPSGKLLGEEWYKDLDPPVDGEEGYTVRVELLGPVNDADGGRGDDEPDGRADDDDDDEPVCVARLRVESFDNREAWPVAFAIASALVERLGGDLRDDEFDEDLYLQQLHLPKIALPGSGGAPPPEPAVVEDDDRYLN